MIHIKKILKNKKGTPHTVEGTSWASASELPGMLYKNGALLSSLLEVKVLASEVSSSQDCYKNKKSKNWVAVNTFSLVIHFTS